MLPRIRSFSSRFALTRGIAIEHLWVLVGIGAMFLALSWKEIEWIKERWGGKLKLKGVCDIEDAKLAVATGADAILVSNHGGRQLDGAPSSISMLPGIVDAVGDRIEIHFDGGIRSGQDVLKALCLGAKGTYIGRAARAQTSSVFARSHSLKWPQKAVHSACLSLR